MRGSYDLPRSALVKRCASFFIVLLAGSAAIALVGMLLMNPSHDHPPSSPLRKETNAQRPSPSLRCLFSDFTHARVVVGFEFTIAFAKGFPPRFAERGEAVREEPEVDFDPGNQPIWSYTLDEGTPMITSPRGETRIVLYGFKPDISDASWIEAGIRSNDFRNLDGKCLQAHFPGKTQSVPTKP